MHPSSSKILSGLMGACVGDALGVPVEFTSRMERRTSPVTTMQGYGTWNQPPGTWSDDSSLMFCLGESLCQGFDLEAIAETFCRWYEAGYWTPHGEVFDIGNATRVAIGRLQRGIPALHAGGTGEQSNGNGSLMRILPLAFYFYKTLNFPELIQQVHQVSAITHAHPRSQMACGIYISIAICLLEGATPPEAYLQGLENVAAIYNQAAFPLEASHFSRVFSGKIAALPEATIRSEGYVIDTLEAALWCLLNTSTYAEAVLKAVNLGGDTDTTATVTGGLAGIYYGFDNLPKTWVKQIVRRENIMSLAARLEAIIYSI